MCGICGFVTWSGKATARRVQAMAGTLAHRGPDAQGIHVDGPAALGHRRLSIIDLSEASNEPIANEDGSLWLVFNGEIYNFRELRKELAGRHRFRSQGDAEVILHLYEESGPDAVSRLDGMFAFALWDSRRRLLLLARDRSGKKPLFFHGRPGFLAFASELKALLAHPEVPHARDETALPLYLTHGYVPSPRTFYRGIASLPAGHVLLASDTGISEPSRYWRARFRSGPAVPEDEAADQLRTLLREAVRRRLLADVPLGAFLSGGLDSSAVVALMSELGGRVRTFTIGFSGHHRYDEREHARTVANRFGTDHTEFEVEPAAFELLDRLVWHHDGPFADSSAVPAYLLCQLTRSRVTVALNGDGGDEVLAGYLRLYAGALSEQLPRWPFRWAAAASLRAFEPRDRRHWLRLAKRFAEAGALPLPERYLQWAGVFTRGLSEILRPELRETANPEATLDSYLGPLAAWAEGPAEERTPLSRLLQLNFETYLPDDLHAKMDRASMAHALETRSPFLDTAVVEFCASLPDALRVRLGRGKLLLRRAMQGVLPKSILARGKAGFGVPLGAWFRGDLATRIEERLLAPTSPIYEYLLPGPVAALIADHRRGAGDLSPQIWALLTLESWLRQEREWR